MKKSLIFLLTLSLFALISIGAKADNNEEYDPLQTALALNYCQMSICRIVTYNDKIVLDQEYDAIINNINLSKIEDKEIIQLLLSLMDSLTQSKLAAGDKEWVRKGYEKQVEKAVYDSFSNGAGLVAGAATDVVMGNFGGAAKNLTQVGMQYFNYQKMLEEQKDSLDKSNWEIEKDVLEFLNYQRKRMLSVSWELIQRYDLPDKWRLTEKQINNYVDILKDGQIERRFRKLERVEDDFQAYPPFWYFYGKTAQDLGKNEFALQCYRQYEAVRKGIFRNDPFYASTCMNRIGLLDNINDKPEILRNLQIITEQGENDNNLTLFCGLNYMKVGEYSNAIDLFQKNIDEEYQVSLNKRLYGEALLAQKSESDLESLIAEMVNNDRVKNQDIIYLMGKYRNIDKLKTIEKQISEINLSIEMNLLTKEDVIVKIPVKWFFDDLKVSLEYASNIFPPKSMESDENEKVIYCKFDAVVDKSDLYDSADPAIFKLKMDHPSCPIELIFESTIKMDQKETVSGKIADSKYTPKWVKNKIENNLSEKKEVKELSISIKKINSGGESFEIKDGKIAQL